MTDALMTGELTAADAAARSPVVNLNGSAKKADLRAYLAERGIDAPAKATRQELAEVASGVHQLEVANESYPTRTKSKVCIVGFAESSRSDVPWDDDDMEFWGINRLHVQLPQGHWDRYFQIHDARLVLENDQEHHGWLKAQKIPIYMRPEDIAGSGIPTAVPYPKGAVLRDFRPYLTNTISWLLAMAIAMEFTEIHVYGVDMAQDGIINAEYRAQRPSCEYFIGLAEGRGIKVVMPTSTDLLKSSHLYGFEDAGLWVEKMMARNTELGRRKEEAKQQLQNLENQKAQVVAAVNQLDGAMQDVGYWLTNWSPQMTEEKDDGTG